MYKRILLRFGSCDLMSHCYHVTGIFCFCPFSVDMHLQQKAPLTIEIGSSLCFCSFTYLFIYLFWFTSFSFSFFFFFFLVGSGTGTFLHSFGNSILINIFNVGSTPPPPPTPSSSNRTLWAKLGPVLFITLGGKIDIIIFSWKTMNVLSCSSQLFYMG